MLRGKRIEDTLKGSELSYLRKVESDFYAELKLFGDDGAFSRVFVDFMLKAFGKYRAAGDAKGLRQLTVRLCEPGVFPALINAIASRSRRMSGLSETERRELETRMVELRLAIEEMFASDIMEFINFCDEASLPVEGFTTITHPDSIVLHDEWFETRIGEIAEFVRREEAFYEFLRGLRAGRPTAAPEPRIFLEKLSAVRARLAETSITDLDPEDQPLKYLLDAVNGEKNEKILNLKRAALLNLLEIGLDRLRSLRKLVTEKKFETDYFQYRINRLRGEVTVKAEKSHRKIIAALRDTFAALEKDGSRDGGAALSHDGAVAAIFARVTPKKMERILTAAPEEIAGEIETVEKLLAGYYAATGRRPARMRRMLEKIDACLRMYRNALNK